MDKYEYIVNLAEKTAKRVSQNRESWMKFLTSAARIYKYPFKEQLLIYAQNPVRYLAIVVPTVNMMRKVFSWRKEAF